MADATTKKKILSLSRSRLDNHGRGYYDAPIDTGEPCDDEPATLALWALLAPVSAEDKADEELRRKIAGLQFANIPGYFPTPAKIVAQMIERADLSRRLLPHVQRFFEGWPLENGAPHYYYNDTA